MTKQITLRLTDEEYKIIQGSARKQHNSLSGYIKFVLIAVNSENEYDELKEANKQLNVALDTINKMVSNANKKWNAPLVSGKLLPKNIKNKTK